MRGLRNISVIILILFWLMGPCWTWLPLVLFGYLHASVFIVTWYLIGNDRQGLWYHFILKAEISSLSSTQTVGPTSTRYPYPELGWIIYELATVFVLRRGFPFEIIKTDFYLKSFESFLADHKTNNRTLLRLIFVLNKLYCINEISFPLKQLKNVVRGAFKF